MSAIKMWGGAKRSPSRFLALRKKAKKKAEKLRGRAPKGKVKKAIVRHALALRQAAREVNGGRHG